MKRIAAAIAAFAALCAHAQAGAYAIAVHGGAGNFTRADLPPATEAQQRAVLAESLEAGRRILAAGGTSLDAVVAAVRIMEDSPLFNAGKGSVFTAEGTNEMDASIMDGRNRRAGAVAGVTTVRNPITAARAVMDKSPHVMVAGRSADQFAKEQGVEIVDPSYFRTQQRWDQLLRARERGSVPLDQDPSKAGAARKTSTLAEDEKYGTVGAVALDKSGNLAAATSTGGITNKRYGRIGDSSIIGAGTWAENESVAVSMTGTGEMILRNASAHDIAALVKYRSYTPQKAADEAVAQVKALDGRAGAIVMDGTGEAAFAFNTSAMYRGFAKGPAPAEIHVYR
jgi:beta-aspartyl-peptidase (threonine type)